MERQTLAAFSIDSRRKDELEKKRLKVQESRRARVERKSVLTELQKSEKENAISVPKRDRKDLDDLVNSLVGDRTPVQPVTATLSDAPMVASTASQSIASCMTSAVNEHPIEGVPSGTAWPNQSQQRYIPRFTEVEALIFDFPPKEREIYNKEVQTTFSSFDEPQPDEEAIRLRLRAEKEKEEAARLAKLEEKAAREAASKEEVQKPIELSEEERKQVLGLPAFLDFFDTTTKMVERALNESYDFMKDYTVGVDRDDDTKSGVKLICKFYDDRWSKNRDVTDVGWSPKHPELVLASYNRNPHAINDPDGIACVWNLHLLERPEFVFYSQSDVLCAQFSPFHPNLVVGGTYAGQILLWDTRSKHLPILKTPLSAAGHTHPVYSMTMVGTQNAHNLITASTDGLVCSWQLDMLAQPQETLELVHTAHPKFDEVAVTTFDFPDNETGSLWVGTEEGGVYQANRHDRAGSKAGINQNDVYRGHSGAITGLHFHPLFGPVDFSDLFLTSSVDWTVKLWRARPPSKTSASQNIISPVNSFEESSDYVYDVKWSTSHPAMFGTVNGSGKFDIWNLNHDTEVVFVSTPVGDSGKACNKLSWDKEGRKAAVGSSDGGVYVYDVGELSQPRSEDWGMFQKLAYEMTQNSMHSNADNVGK